MQEHSAHPDMVMMSPDPDGHPQQQYHHQTDPYQYEAQQVPYYQCVEQKPFDPMMLDPVLRSDVAEDRPFVRTPALTPIYNSYRNLSSLDQPAPTFSSSPALQTLRGMTIMGDVK
jgi:hypothetical protein